MRTLISFMALSLFCVNCCAQKHQAPTEISSRADYLVQLAEKKLNSAENLLRRGAIWSARNHCLEAMQLLASSQDGKSQDNIQTTKLSLGLQCLREAEDFASGIGGATSLHRIIESHETPVLKKNAKSVVSELSAHQAYLHFSKTCFQASLGENAVASLGSRATYLYGRAILKAKDAQEWHALAVSETLYGIAITLDPNNASAHRELGILLLEAGDESGATHHLVKSAKLAPTRRAYAHLRKAALAENLPKVVAICDARLSSGDYLPNIKVISLSPEEFAATHNATSQQQSPKPVPHTQATNEKSSTERVATRQTLKRFFGLAR